MLFAGSAQPTKFGASHVLLRLGQYTILDCIASEQAVIEAERNLRAKAPSTVATFQALIDVCVRVVPDPYPDELARYRHFADPKDVPILTAALIHGAAWLLTFNVRDYWPSRELISVRRPGDFLRELRAQLAHLGMSAPSENE